MGDIVFYIIPITHGMNAFDGYLLVSCRIDEGTKEKGEELPLRSVNVDHIFRNINYFFVKNLFHYLS